MTTDIERIENRLDGVKAELNELNELRKNELRKREDKGKYEWLVFIMLAAMLIFGTYMALGGWAAFAAIGLVLLFGWVRRAMP